MKFMEKIRVMLAEDNQSILRLLSDFLSGKPEIELVAAVSDGAAILDAVREHGPDVLVMDVIMPRKDGFMALEELGRIDECARPKVIVLTGLSRDDFIMRAIALGASYYMVKPFDLHVLYHRILEVAGEEPDVVAPSAPRATRAGRSRRLAFATSRPALPRYSISSWLRPAFSRPPMTAMVAGTAPFLRMVSSTSRAVSTFFG